jgi:hypothetical protein
VCCPECQSENATEKHPDAARESADEPSAWATAEDVVRRHAREEQQEGASILTTGRESLIAAIAVAVQSERDRADTLQAAFDEALKNLPFEENYIAIVLKHDELVIDLCPFEQVESVGTGPNDNETPAQCLRRLVKVANDDNTGGE